MACNGVVRCQHNPDGGSDSIFCNKGLNIARDVRNLGSFAGELQSNLGKEHRVKLTKAIVCVVRKNDRNALQIIKDHMEENGIGSVVEGALSYWIAQVPASRCSALDLYDMLCDVDDGVAQQCEGLLELKRTPSHGHTGPGGRIEHGRDTRDSPGCTRPDVRTQTKKSVVFTGMPQAALDVYFEQLAAVLESEDLRRLSNILLKEHFPIGSTAVDNFARDNDVSSFQAMATLWLKKQMPQADGAGYVAALATFNRRAAMLSEQILATPEPSH